jgi:hypothetical protein
MPPERRAKTANEREWTLMERKEVILSWALRRSFEVSPF